MEGITLNSVTIEKVLYNQTGVVEVSAVRRKDPSRSHEVLCMKKVFVDSIHDANEKLRESLLMLSVSHPNIVRLFGTCIGGADNIEYVLLFMEYMPEGDFGKLIKRRISQKGFWTQKEILDYLVQLIPTYAHLQRNGIAHRDIKPENILLAENNKKLKIADFGVSKFIYDHRHTITGTPLYLSPLAREAYTSLVNYNGYNLVHNAYKSDVYSLGLILLLMTTLMNLSDFSKLDPRQGKIIQVINELSNSYSKIKILLQLMLNYNEENRPDFLQLEELLKQLIESPDNFTCKVCKGSKPENEFYIFENESTCKYCVSRINFYMSEKM